MKRLILFILLIASFDAFAAPPPISTFPLTVTQATPHAVGPTGYTSGIIPDAMTALGAVAHEVRLIATTNVATLSGAQTIDGFATSSGDIVLLTAQTSSIDNGPWQAQTGAWTRPDWYQNGSTTQAKEDMMFIVRSGALSAGARWQLNTANPIIVGTTPTSWLVRPINIATMNGTLAAGQFPILTGDVTNTVGTLAITITNSAVTLAKMANVATGTVFYRKTAGTGAPEVQPLATLRTDLAIPTATPYPTPTPGWTGGNAAAHTVFGNFTGSSALPTFNALSTNLDAFFTNASAGNLRAAIASNAVTGSAGNLVFSIGPAITGTMTTQAITAGGLVDVTAGGFRAAGNGTGFTAGAGVELVYSEPRGYLQTYLRPSGPYKQFAIEGVATMLNPNSGGTAGAGPFGPTNTPQNVFHVVGNPSNNTAIGIATTAPNLRIGSSGTLSAYWDIGRENATTGDFLFNDATTEAARITTSTRRLGVGTGATVSARIHAISTTEQLRLGFDASNYVSTTVGSTGAVTFDAVGTGAAFLFNDAVGIPNIPSGSPTPVPIAGYGKLYLTDGNLKYISPVDGPGGPHITTLANQ